LPFRGVPAVVEVDLSRRRFVLEVDEPHERALSRAALAHNAQDLTGVNLQRDVAAAYDGAAAAAAVPFVRGDAAGQAVLAPIAEELGESAYLEERFHRGHLLSQ
jgi:hypothetical protein